VLAPLAALPTKLGDVFWRLINASLLLGGVLAAARALAPGHLTRRQLTALLVLMFPPALGHLSNGQSNALVIGLALLAVAAVVRGRWNLAASALAVSTLFKLYPISAGLLLSVVHPRRFGPRYLAALAVGLAVPFLCQHADYVLRQYGLWFHYMIQEDRSNWNASGLPVDLALLFRAWLTPIDLRTYRIIVVVAGLTFGAVCLLAVRSGRSERRTLTLVLGLACVWMTVFGPATESPTYLILAPSVAWGVITAWTEPVGGRRTVAVVRVLMTVSYGLLVSLQLAGWFGPLFHSYRVLGPQPIAGLLFLAGLLVQTAAPDSLTSERPTASWRPRSAA
jgi:hypothetical protein